MAVDTFIPVWWSAKLLLALDTALVYGQHGVVSRDYEGEIRQAGDAVKINSVGDVTVKTYTRNTDMDAPEELQTAEQMLLIDQAKYFNFQVDDVDIAQAKPGLPDEAMRRASYSLRNVADSYIAGVMVAALVAGNKIGTEAAPKQDLGTAGKAYEYLVDLGVKLDQTDTPDAGRWVVVPSWFHGLLLKDSRFVASGTAEGDAVRRTGKVGEAAGFTILKSNQVPKTTATTKFKIIAGVDMATSYAEQIVKVEASRMEKRFADGVKGLHVYGAKVVRPNQLAALIADMP